MVGVNSICPDMVWTELIEQAADVLGVDFHEAQKAYPLKRYGKPAAIANLVVYLVSDASTLMTGNCIEITGGGEFSLKV